MWTGVDRENSAAFPWGRADNQEQLVELEDLAVHPTAKAQRAGTNAKHVSDNKVASFVDKQGHVQEHVDQRSESKSLRPGIRDDDAKGHRAYGGAQEIQEAVFVARVVQRAGNAGVTKPVA